MVEENENGKVEEELIQESCQAPLDTRECCGGGDPDVLNQAGQL